LPDIFWDNGTRMWIGQFVEEKFMIK
jgi:hypothetical protein